MQQGQQSSQKPWLGNRTNPLQKILTSKPQTKSISSISRGLLSQQRVSNAAFHPTSHTWQPNASVGGGGGGGLDSQCPVQPHFPFSPPLSKDDIPSDTQIHSQDTLHMHIINNNNNNTNNTNYPRPPPQQTAHRLLENMVMRGVNSLNHHHQHLHHQSYPTNNNNNQASPPQPPPPLNFSFSPPTAPESLPSQQQQHQEDILTRVKHLEDMVTGVEDRVSQGITTLETTLLSSFQSGLQDISNKIKDQHASLLSTINSNNAAEAEIKNSHNNIENNNSNKAKVRIVYMNAAAQTDPAYGLRASNGILLAATAATLHSHHTIDQPSPSSVVASHNGTATAPGTDEKKEKEGEEGGTGDGGGYGDDGRGGGGGVFGDLESLIDDEVQGGGGGGGGKRRRDKNVAAKEDDEQQDDDKEMQEMERRVKAKLAKHHRQLAKKQQKQGITATKAERP